MRRHRKIEDESSLELLLDTMCNTFGGVMFIAISIFIVTSAMTSEQAKENNDNTDQSVLQQEITTLRQLCQTLTEDIEQKLAQTAAQKDSRTDSALQEIIMLQKMLQSTELQLNAQQQLSTSVDELLKKQQAELSRLATLLKKADSQNKPLTEQQNREIQLARQLKKQLDSESAINFQVMRASTQEPFFIMMRNNKVYPVGPWRNNGAKDRIDDSVSCINVQTEQGELVTCQIKPDRGINVLENNGLSQEFSALLKLIPPDRIADFNISPDSAATAHRMREIFKSQQLRHGCSLARDDSAPFKFYYKEKAEYEY